MFDTYLDIYDQRGHFYHKAMTRWPQARRAEFENLVDCVNADLRDSLVLDVPSGGGYLTDYLPDTTRLISVDAAPKFLNAGAHLSDLEVICAPHDSIPLGDDVADVIFSLAGLHHIKDQQKVFDEWYRLLKPGGVLVIADASSGSKTARFLDGVVGKHNSMGHQGLYLRQEHTSLLENAGFEVQMREEKSYPWAFENVDEMLLFCRTLFCLDHEPSDQQLLEGIAETIGFSDGSPCCMNWGLCFIRAIKPPMA